MKKYYEVSIGDGYQRLSVIANSQDECYNKIPESYNKNQIQYIREEQAEYDEVALGEGEELHMYLVYHEDSSMTKVISSSIKAAVDLYPDSRMIQKDASIVVA